MRRTVLSLLLLLATSLAAQTPQTGEQSRAQLQSLLERLDDIVEHKADYHANYNEQIDKLKAQAARSQGIVRINLYKEIYELYSHYQTDSAQTYLERLAKLPETKDTPSLQAYVLIGRSEIYAVAGLYAQAVESLQAVNLKVVGEEDGDLALFYYRTARTLYGWMTDYTAMPEPHRLYAEQTRLYRDTLLTLSQPKEERDIVVADQATATGNPQRAISILLPYAEKMSVETPDPYLCFTLYQAYTALGRKDESLYHLVLTAIADLQRATTEYQALPILAQRMYDLGDMSRAYNYLICSMEDASYCRAMLRTVEVQKIFPIINKQYKQDEQDRNRNKRLLTVALVVALAALVTAVFYLRRQIKKLHTSRRLLAESNEQQREANDKLQQTLAQLQDANAAQQQANAALQLTDKMKEEYIARYLNRCRDYLDSMLERQHFLNRLYKERRMDELSAELKSSTSIKEEQDRFYADFDAAFLTLFPDFIAKFNALLRPEEHFAPKHDGALNTELRIFALIRLGITDTQRIAHFLNYSVATVYNYRSKIRNKAVGNPADFEAAVGQIGSNS